MKGKASKIILVVLIILVMLSVFIAGTMIAMPVLKKKDVIIAKDQTDKIKHSYANEDTSSSDSQEITRNYEIKSEETWDISKNQDGSVMAKWTLSDKTIRISGSGEMKDWGWNDKSDWHGTGYSEVIRNVVIEDGVTSIGDYAFKGCSSLKSIEIPSSVTYIGDEAFYGCDSLASIEIPSSVTSIGSSAFSSCSSLKSIEIPGSVTSIGSGVFMRCTSLTEIKVDINNEKYADENGILYDKNKTKLICHPAGKAEKSFVIPSSVTSIGNYAFYGCSSLESIEIPSSVTSIGYRAFERCSSLASIEIPSSVTSIGNNAFCECSSLASIKIPSSVTHVGGSAIPKNTIIYAQADSEAHKYAEENKQGYIIYEYEIKNNYVVKIKPNTTYNKFTYKMPINGTYTIKEGEKEIGGTDLIKTGQILTTKKGEQYTLVVLGDLNGDGKISLVELARISKIGAGKIKDYKEIEKMAIDANADGSINILDMAAISKLAVE